MARFYGMDAQTVGRLTLKQLNGYMANIEYVIPAFGMEVNKKFMKAPEPELPKLPIVRYAERCGVMIPFEVHLELLKNGLDA